jgi:hypothetical protein
MTETFRRSVAFRVTRTDRVEAHRILSSVPGFTVDEEGLSSGAWAFVVLVCGKEYDAPDAAARAADIDLAETMLNAAGITHRNLGPTRQDADTVQDTELMAVSRATGQRYGRIEGRHRGDIHIQLQRISELYDIPLTELDTFPLAD